MNEGRDAGVGAAVTGARHLYVHLPFCAHRCGYCDFVTVVGRPEQHARYVSALLAELVQRQAELAPALETVFVGGGTPTFTDPGELGRLLGGLPGAAEVTVEANPETVTGTLAALLAASGVTRVSLGAQSFEPTLLEVLERRAGPDDVRRAVHHLRDANIDNISLDLVYGIPGQSTAVLDRDLAEAVALEPEHLSLYELEAKPGTRFTHAWAAELDRQAEAMEGYFERVVDRLTGAGYRWYETANFCNGERNGAARDLRAQHNLGYWRGSDYVGLGIGAFSTVAGSRRRNRASLGAYLDAVEQGRAPGHEVEVIDDATACRERVMLGLRLDEPLELGGLEEALDNVELRRLEEGGLIEVGRDASGAMTTLLLTRRGRFLGGGVTARLLA